MSIGNRNLFVCDNLRVLRGIDSNTIDLIATDPPFNSKRSFHAPLGTKAAEQRFNDVWRWDDVTDEWHDLIASDYPDIKQLIECTIIIEGGHIEPSIETSTKNSIAAYLAWMAPRVIEMHRVLKQEGSIYIHCDDSANSYLRLLLDSVFGAKQFRNELIWKRAFGKGLNPTKFVRNTDRILYYSKGNTPVWNQLFKPLDKEYVDKYYLYKDSRGKYRISDLTGGKKGGPESYKPFKGVLPSSGRAWAPPKRDKFPTSVSLTTKYENLSPIEKCEALDKAKLIHWPNKHGGMPHYKKYLSSSPGNYIDDIIDDIAPISHLSNESTGWATQKPLQLYKKLIEASSNEGDIVLDPFCGCATTCVAAEALQRNWVGIDIDPTAEKVTLDRLKNEVGLFNFSTHPVTVRKNPPKRTDIGSISDKKLRLVLWNNQGHRCANPYCTSGVLREVDLQLDHRIPKVRGGADDPTNRIGLCANCNSRKGRKSWAKFLDKERSKQPHPKI